MMLVLTRRVSEKIEIGENIRIVVLGIEGKQVKLGFEAPRSIRILRSELRDRMNKEKENEES